MSTAQAILAHPAPHDWHGALDGDLALLHERVARPDDERDFLPAAELVVPDRLGPLLDRYAARFDPGLRASAISFWSLYHLSGAILPIAALAMLSDRMPAAALSQVSFAFSEEGESRAARIAPDETLGPCDAVAVLETLITDHLEPTVAALVAISGLAPRLFWNNAASYFDWVVRAAADHPRVPRERAEAALRLVDAAVLPCGAPNPMHGAIRPVLEDGAETRRRKVCCLRYKLPGVPGCGGLCPLPAVRQAGREQ
ncbi:ferric iron reductase protein FhuF [Chelatococcus caeni]|uniref:Ferric iron reductase protein FhuF n=1 Tax=Chelatococcus caeni TaxID=1348468 RepID=A0A840BZ56_9HYPH|nr:siderophore-iron reductase FhuF [Chelatococcus caeni]MBB4018444.1 ferric iron reductase protein FhuF [Chelatococcus caeni]